MKRSFIDAGVLIAAARGQGEIAARALEVLDDPQREFVSSLFVRLEVLPKAVYHQRTDEAEFYEAFFSGVTHWVDDLDSLVQEAHQIACDLGLAALDALHVAAATAAGADELVTTEDLRKPIHRATTVRVVSIREESGDGSS